MQIMTVSKLSLFIFQKGIFDETGKLNNYTDIFKKVLKNKQNKLLGIALCF